MPEVYLVDLQNWEDVAGYVGLLLIHWGIGYGVGLLLYSIRRIFDFFKG